MSEPRLNVEIAGRPDGDPMLLVHGFLSSNAQWDLNRDALGERMRLHMVELPGHGLSDAPDDRAAYGTDAVVAALEQVRIDHNVDRWWICGQSLGAAVVIRYCLAHPDRARGLVFTNSRAVFGVPRKDAEAAGRDLPPPLTSLRDLPFHPINAKRFPEAVKQRMVAAADAMPLHAVNHITEHRNSWAAVDRFHELALPVLLINGQWESRFQTQIPIAIERIPHLKVVDLEGGHSINVEQADQFNAAVLDFVGSNGAIALN